MSVVVTRTQHTFECLRGGNGVSVKTAALAIGEVEDSEGKRFII